MVAYSREFNSRVLNNELEAFFMKAVVDLFSTDYGLLSLGVLLFIIVMAVWFLRFFARKMDESARTQR